MIRPTPLFPLCAGVLSALSVLPAGAAPVVINEIHYDMEDATQRREFIELHNPGAEPVDLAGWRFDRGVDFIFPAGAVLPAGGYVVVCQDTAAFTAKFGLSGAAVFGPWTGRLSNSGEDIRLLDAAGTVADEVDYQSGFPWPVVGVLPDYSIELTDPALDNSVGGNWRASRGMPFAPLVMVPPGSPGWHYRKGTDEPSPGAQTDWTKTGFAEDATWLTGATPVGFGSSGALTVATELTDMPGNYSTVYFRHTFTLPADGVPGSARVRVYVDDGALVYLNGQEVTAARYGYGSGAAPFDGTATLNVEATWKEFTVPGALLQGGENVLAIHALNVSAGSSDFLLDAELGVPAGLSSAGPTPLAANSMRSASAPPAVRHVEHEAVVPVAGRTYFASGQDVRISAEITDPQGVASATVSYQVVEPGDYIAITDARYNDAASWIAVAMNDSGAGSDLLAGDGVWSATIPGTVQTHRRLIRYRIATQDTGGAALTVPYEDDPQPNFAYFVYDALPAWNASKRPGVQPVVTYTPEVLGSLPVYHFLTTLTSHVEAQHVPLKRPNGTTQNPATGGYTGSLYQWHGCLCYDGKVYDHVRYRARGGVWRYAMGKNMWKLDFNRSHDFEPRDNDGKRYGASWKKLNLGSVIQQGDFGRRGEQGLQESVGFRLFQLSGLESCHTHFIHWRVINRPDEANGSADQYDDDFQGLYLAVEQLDGQFLDEHNLPDGNLYKMEGGSGELNNQGPEQPKNKSDLNAFIGGAGYAGANGNSEVWWRANADLDRYFKYRSVVDSIHHYDIADGKNYFYYHNPETGKWSQVGWDLDLTWADNMYRANTGTQGIGSTEATEPFMTKIRNIPALMLEYRNQCRHLHDLLFTPEQTGMLIDELAAKIWQPDVPCFVDADCAMWDFNPILGSSSVDSSKAGYDLFYKTSGVKRDFPYRVGQLKSYVTTRRNVMRSKILTDEAQIPVLPVVGAAAASVPVNALTFTSSAYQSPGTDAFAALQWRIAEVTDPAAAGYDANSRTEKRKYEMEGWTSPEMTAVAASYTFPASTVHPGETVRVRVRHKDAAGRWSHWSAPVQFAAGVPDVSVYLAGLVISEVHYHPAGPVSAAERAVSINADDFEFIELLNAGPVTLDLTDVRFTRGIDFDFAGSAVTSLAPGERVIVAGNLAAFTARYGAGLPVAGEFGGNLDNNGETLKLSFGAGTAIREFAYGDSAPWPFEADGSGPSLTLLTPSAVPDHALAANWAASTLPGGSPGTSDVAAWLVAHGLPADSPADADGDGDGLPLAIEYALGTDPAIASPERAPTAGLVEEGGEMRGFLQVTAAPGAGAAGLSAEYSADLVTWVPGAATVAAGNPDGTQVLTWRSPAGAGGRGFFRLRAGW